MQPGLIPFNTDTEQGRKRASDAGKKGAATREANRKRKQDAVAQLEHQTDLIKAKAQQANQPADIPTRCERAIEHTLERVNTGQLELASSDVPAFLLACNTIARLARGEATTHTATTTITQQQTSQRLKALQATNHKPPHKP